MPNALHAARPAVTARTADLASGAERGDGAWPEAVAKVMAGATLLSALAVPTSAAFAQARAPDLAPPKGQTTHLNAPPPALPQGTKFRLVAPGPQHKVAEREALSYILAAYRAQDGSRVSLGDVKILNPAIFARDPTGSVLHVAEMVTMPFGAIKVNEPKKLVVAAPSAPVVAPPGGAAPTPAVAAAPIVAEPKPVVVETKPVAVETKAIVVETKPVVVETKPVVVETKPVEVKPVETTPTVPAHAAFKFPPLRPGASLPVEGVFKVQKFFKLWTIEFGGTAKVVASEFGKLVVHVKGTAQNGVLAGMSRTVSIEIQQDGTSSKVSFLARDLEDKDGEKIAKRVELLRSSPTESVFQGSDGPISLKLNGKIMTIEYGANTVRVNVGG